MRHSKFGGRWGRKVRFLGMALFMVAGIAAMGWLVMLLWNWLMPALFTGAGQIDYWRALGLLLLCKLLFGGHRHHWLARRQHWDSMTPEERTQFREQFKRRWTGRFGDDRTDCRGGRSSKGAPSSDIGPAPGAQERPSDAS